MVLTANSHSLLPVASTLSAGKWYTSIEQPHDEIHLAVGGQDQRRSRKKAHDKCRKPVGTLDLAHMPVSRSVWQQFVDEHWPHNFFSSLLSLIRRRCCSQDNVNVANCELFVFVSYLVKDQLRIHSEAQCPGLRTASSSCQLTPTTALVSVVYYSLLLVVHNLPQRR